MRIRRVLAAAAAALGLAVSPAAAQEPATRAEVLEREREAKAAAATPPEENRVERLLLGLESGRLLERLLNPPEGLYPKIGNITAGSGFSAGPGYRNSGLFNERATFGVFAAASLQRYWMISTSLEFPSLAHNRIFADVHARTFDFPEEEFFGIGPISRREDLTTYDYADTIVGGGAGVRVTKWFSLSGAVDHLSPRVGQGTGERPIASIFNPVTIAGFVEEPDYVRYKAVADVNYRQPRGNPRRGGQYTLTFQQYDDQKRGLFDFHRIDADVQQYFPFLQDRRVIAMRLAASVANAPPGNRVPFYFQPTLGGPDDLRGFRRFRFRDDNMILFQAEYRWEIFTAMDGAIFYDVGKVTPNASDLDLTDLERDFGIGFRFGTSNGVFLRVEGAFGSSGGTHFILRFGHVF